MPNFSSVRNLFFFEHAKVSENFFCRTASLTNNPPNPNSTRQCRIALYVFYGA